MKEGKRSTQPKLLRLSSKIMKTNKNIYSLARSLRHCGGQGGTLAGTSADESDGRRTHADQVRGHRGARSASSEGSTQHWLTGAKQRSEWLHSLTGLTGFRVPHHTSSRRRGRPRRIVEQSGLHLSNCAASSLPDAQVVILSIVVWKCERMFFLVEVREVVAVSVRDTNVYAEAVRTRLQDRIVGRVLLDIGLVVRVHELIAIGTNRSLPAGSARRAVLRSFSIWLLRS